ncbi:uncharacterized protein KD926_007476 [Aspergillus affinis]|uniref:uncharacterized protein n=1 Tax=Aspergillus affinis TaxID=1070780 RepID=UPI0022FEC30C|nr:uncharacterized protein KD926_007476 [Aspergillus affinis]KAI9041059.1 hypothetical protein KD926_007476 [Aspergillus affinis]
MSRLANDPPFINLPIRPCTGLLADDALAKFLLEPLEPYDTTEAYIKAKVTTPSDHRICQNWGILNTLLYKMIAGVIADNHVRNVNIYHYGKLNPGALLVLTASRVKQGWLEAHVSSVEGTLLATAVVLHSDKSAAVYDRVLGSPIVFSKQFQDPSQELEATTKRNEMTGFRI